MKGDSVFNIYCSCLTVMQLHIKSRIEIEINRPKYDILIKKIYIYKISDGTQLRTCVYRSYAPENDERMTFHCLGALVWFVGV